MKMRRPSSTSSPTHVDNLWGRAGAGQSWLRSLGNSSLVFIGPFGITIAFIVLTAFEGSFCAFAAAAFREGFWTIFDKHRPRLTVNGALALACWIAWQALLSQCLPAKVRTGQYTPAGHALTYRLNGLSAWVVTHLAFFAFSWLGILDPAFIPRNWSGLVAAMNYGGFLAATLAFIKAYVWPTHPDDCKFSRKLRL